MMIEIYSGEPKLYGRRKQVLKEGCDLDELQSHVFLEKMKETLTVLELRKRMKALDIDNNKRMALSEYLLDLFKKTPKQLVDAPQGDTDPVKLQAAKDAVEAASEAIDIAVEAKPKAQAAEAALKRAVAVLAAEEKAFNDRLAALERLASSGGGVKAMKAKNEIAQIKSEDPLPLRKAKITQNAAFKAAEKATKAAIKAIADAKAALVEAEAQLQAVKNAGGGVCQGAIWWMERGLAEKKKFM